MLKRVALIALLVVPTFSCTMWSKPASGWTGATGGEQIERLFWKDVQGKNWAQVDRHVGATFTGTGTGGTLDRAAFLKDLQQTPLTDVSLSECNSQLNGGDVIVTCTLQATRGGQPSMASTLSVWHQLKKGWVMVAHSEVPRASRT